MDKLNNENFERVDVIADQDFREYVEKFHGKSYNQEELEESFNIESTAYGGVLCTRKGTEELVLLNKVMSPTGDEVLYIITGGF